MGNFSLGLLFGAIVVSIIFVIRHSRQVAGRYHAAKAQFMSAKASFEAERTLHEATNVTIAVMEYLSNVEKYMRMHGEHDAIDRIRNYQKQLNGLIDSLDQCSTMEAYPRVIKQVQQAKTFVDRYLSQYKG